MKLVTCFSCLLLALSPGLVSSTLAGDDAANGTAATTQAARPTGCEIEDYLHGQRISHVLVLPSADGKGEGTNAVVVKIYGIESATQQDDICTNVAAAGKKGRLHEVSVLFYTMVPDNRPVAFSPSRLPSGSGDVSFARETETVTFKLQRTVKL